MFGSLGALLSNGLGSIGSSLGSLGSIIKGGFTNFMNGSGAATFGAAPKGIMGHLGQILGGGEGTTGLLSSLGSLGKMYTDYAGLQTLKDMQDEKMKIADTNFNNQVNTTKNKMYNQVYGNLLASGMSEEEARAKAEEEVARMHIQGV